MSAQTSLFGLPTKIHRKPASLDERFRLWAFANPQVVELFFRFAQQAKASGKKVGIKAIAERVRWEVYVERKEGSPYKINNSYVSRIARLLVQRDPSLEGMFEFRRLLSNDRSQKTS